MADAVGRDVMVHLQRGYVAGRSPEITFIPNPWNVVVRWSGRTLAEGRRDPRSTHPTPWDYHQRVPLIIYGPGYVRAGIVSNRSVDLTSLAPTFAELLGMRFGDTDGAVLEEGLLPAARRAQRPRLIVLVAYDGGGWNLLAQWPGAWPEQRGLAARGTAYTNATIGSAPAVTAAIHANMGTGVYPRRHGLSENVGRLPDGTVDEIYFNRGDPRLLEAETVADGWDRANGNRPWVGLLGYESWHLGMMGKGAEARDGDRDVGVLWEREQERFWINEDVYDLPGSLPGRDVLDRHLRELDGVDGALDEVWMGRDLTDPSVVPGTSAFVKYQGDALGEILNSEPVGRDELTDFLFVELKPTDFGGHIWNMVAPEEEEVLRAQDQVLGDLIDLLDQRVGADRYVLAVTADHGQTPIPETKGGVRIDPDVVGLRVVEYFRRPIVERTSPSGIFLDMDVVEDAGIDPEDVARYIATLRYRDVLPADADVDLVPSEVADRRVFAAVFPGAFIASLREADLSSFGESAFPEGDLTGPVVGFADLLTG
ncbi:MAG TPA: alkaline phosphatase family protein [Actinomycetota bacterium]|nr:alkaline phosphatase family protein [Actinomycetota bacterium]